MKLNYFDQSIEPSYKIKTIFFDIDDTITTDGKLTANAYQSLWRLKDAGFNLVPITGRPAAWCDHIIRFWPVNAVIGENGAFAFFMKDGKRSRIDTLGVNYWQSTKNNIDRLKEKILKKYPEAKWASDQNYREYDLAIDICEDVNAWPKSKVDDLLFFLKTENVHAKLSSIHVNAWFGDYDKASGIEFWLSNSHPGIDEEVNIDEMIFIGDSPNDEPLFKYFPKCIGVANIIPYLDTLQSHPKWITRKTSGDGFVEFVDTLLATCP